MIKRESKKRRLDLNPLVAVVLAMVFATSALATISIPGDTSVGTWDPVNRIYTLTTDVSETIGNAIEIDEDNLTLDGNGKTVNGHGTFFGVGVYIFGKTGVTVKNLNVQEFDYGINVYWSSYNILANNTVSKNDFGIRLYSSSYNILTGNTTWNDFEGICLSKYSNDNTLTGNTVYGNGFYGIILSDSSYNEIYNNNFIDNLTQACVYGDSSENVFNLDGSVGNYWSDHTGPDEDGDGFVDSPYVCWGGGQDNLPWVSQDGWLMNQPPVANAGSGQLIECARQQGGTTVALNGSGSDDPEDDPLTYTWIGPFAESPASGPTPTVTLLDGCVGDYEITLVVNDGELDSEPDTVQITVVDTTPPTINSPGPITVEAQSTSGVPASDPEILTFLTGASASDNCDPSPEITDDAPVEFPLGDTIVTFTATDAWTNTSSCQATVTVEDTTPPAITIVAPQLYVLYRVGDLALDFSVTDATCEPMVSATLCTDDEELPVSVGFMPEVGVYTLGIMAWDDAGNTAFSDPVFFVVYDPSGGFVTGGGWIYSESGAYKPDLSLEGKANFGFVSKYKKGATVPTGNTEFQFKAGDLNFHSSSYDWLVVTGSDYARFKGWGTINGEGDYRFMLWAGDGEPDTFRIKIWWEDGDTENVVYDNGFDQEIGGGSIVVHVK